MRPKYKTDAESVVVVVWPPFWVDPEDVYKRQAMIRIGAGTIGLLSVAEARKEGVEDASAKQKRAVHVEFSSDDLDGLYEELRSKGVAFHQPPHDEPWERSMTAFDPDGYAVEFAQGKRGHNQTKA